MAFSKISGCFSSNAAWMAASSSTTSLGTGIRKIVALFRRSLESFADLRAFSELLVGWSLESFFKFFSMLRSFRCGQRWILCCRHIFFKVGADTWSLSITSLIGRWKSLERTSKETTSRRAGMVEGGEGGIKNTGQTKRNEKKHRKRVLRNFKQVSREKSRMSFDVHSFSLDSEEKELFFKFWTLGAIFTKRCLLTKKERKQDEKERFSTCFLPLQMKKVSKPSKMKVRL